MEVEGGKKTKNLKICLFYDLFLATLGKANMYYAVFGIDVYSRIFNILTQRCLAYSIDFEGSKGFLKFVIIS